MTDLAPKQIWITGAGGQLGRCIQDIISQHPNLSGVFSTRNEVELSDPDSVNQWIANHNIQLVINTAAYTAVDKAEDEPDLAVQTNADIPQLLASVCCEKKIPFIHVSTDYVFDGTATEPYMETDTENPQSKYGLSKYLGEQEVLQAHKRNIVVRTSWLYSEYGHNFVKTMLRFGSEKESIRVVNDQFGSPTYARHLASALLTIAENLVADPENVSGGIYHFANSGTATWFDLATAVMDIAGLSCMVESCSTAEYPTKAARPKYSVLATQKIQTTFDLQISPWKEALKEALSKMPVS